MALEVIPVLDDVLCVRRASYLTCSYLWRRDEGVVLVDAGMKTDGADVRAGLEAWGLDASAVAAIFVTHWHNDHSAGAAWVAKASGAPVYYAAAEAAQLTRATASPGLAGWLSDAIPEAGPLVLAKGLLGDAPMVAVTATAHVGAGDALHGLQVLATPGHTAGHLSFFEPERGLLFAGDALAVVDGEIRFMARPVTEDLAAARASMQLLVDLEPEWILAGHRYPLEVEAAHLSAFRARLEAPDWPLLG